MQQHGSTYFDTPQGMGSIGQTSTFSEHGHVAYGIKEFRECSNIVANILLADPSRPCGWGQKVKIQLFMPQRNFGRHIVIALSVRPSHFMSRAYLLYFLGRNSKLGVWMHLGMTECCVPFSGHCDL